MSLQEFFLSRALQEHQNEINEDNFAPVMLGLAQGVLGTIQQQHNDMIEKRKAEEKEAREIETYRKKSDIDVDANNRRTIPVSVVDADTNEIKTVGYVPKGGKVFKSSSDSDSTVTLIDPLSGEIKSSVVVPHGRIYKANLSSDQIEERAFATGKGKVQAENIKSTNKLARAVRRLAILNKQYDEALPAGDKTPLQQRFAGGAESWATKRGLVNNPKLLALQTNIRPIAISLMREFGEVGALSETEQQGAIDVVNQAGLTTEERLEKVRQFAEFALAGADPESIKYLKSRSDIRGLLDSLGVDLDALSSYGDQELTEEQSALVEKYVAGNPGRSREAVIKAMRKQGLLE